MYENDTIAAISSGLTESGIGIVRVSGPDSYLVAEKIFRKPDGRSADLSVSIFVLPTLIRGRILSRSIATAVCLL